MTPERKEEIKRDAQSGQGYEDAFILNHEVLEVLAALEETQQQVEERKIREIDLEEQYKTLYRMYTEMDKSCGETLDLLKETSCLLAAAQQTIARQRGKWQELKDIVSTNATGRKGEDINDYDIMLNIMGDLEGETQP